MRERSCVQATTSARLQDSHSILVHILQQAEKQNEAISPQNITEQINSEDDSW